MSKYTIKKSEFKNFLLEIKFEKGCNLPFVDNYIAYEGHISKCSLLGYLIFLKHQLENYKIIYKFGEIDFQTFLTRRYSLIKEAEVEEESKLDKLDNHLRENFVEEQKISIKDLLELINEFQEE